MRKGIVQYGVSDELCLCCQYRYRADLPAGCYGRCEGRELVQHGSALFPIACYAENLKSYSVAWHWHEEFEYILAMKGPLTVDVNKTRVTLQTNQGVFLNSGILHAVEQAEKGEALLHSGVFHPRWWAEWTPSSGRSSSDPCSSRMLRFFLLTGAVAWQRRCLPACGKPGRRLPWSL